MSGETGGNLTAEERAVLAMGIEFDCPICGHDYRRHYQQHDGCGTCTFDAGSSCPETMVSALGKALAPAVERIIAARKDANAEALARVEALADEWADDTGIEGYINLGEVESRLRRALHPDPSEGA